MAEVRFLFFPYGNNNRGKRVQPDIKDEVTTRVAINGILDGRIETTCIAELPDDKDEVLFKDPRIDDEAIVAVDVRDAAEYDFEVSKGQVMITRSKNAIPRLPESGEYQLISKNGVLEWKLI